MEGNKVLRFTSENGFVTTPARSQLMAKIKAKNTKSEVKLRKALWSLGLRYRVNFENLPGRPDIVLVRLRLVIFVDGEFWHGYNWPEKKARIKSNTQFWITKIERNMQRDVINNERLSALGWTVLRFWDREVKNEFGVCLSRILATVKDLQFNTHDRLS